MTIKETETLKTLTEKFNAPKNTNRIHRDRLSKIERLALLITEKVGTMGFFFLILGWTIAWLGWNIFAPAELRFDPHPAFVLWLFISNLIQIHLMPLIMIGQNIQAKYAELRAEHDYETDLKAEKEIGTILEHLENQQQLILNILKKIESLENKKQ